MWSFKFSFPSCTDNFFIWIQVEVTFDGIIEQLFRALKKIRFPLNLAKLIDIIKYYIEKRKIIVNLNDKI